MTPPRPFQKNDSLTLSVTGLGSNAEGVCRHQGQVVFVPGALPGETVEALVVKKEKRHAYGKLTRVISPSPDRVTPPCPYYPQCGGCSCQHMTYQRELVFKRQHVKEVMARIGGLHIAVAPVLGMETPWAYRNKSSMPVAPGLDGPVAGFYARRSHRVISVERCLIGKTQSDTAAGIVLDWMRQHDVPAYDEHSHTGLVRHIVTRVNTTGQSMVVLAINAMNLPNAKPLIHSLQEGLNGFVSLCVSVNRSRGNVILGDGYQCLWGQPRLEDSLCGSSFLLSPLSFFQVNTSQAEKLYNKALELAAPKRSDKVIDLYCGAGTISSLFARHTDQVLGIESVPQAVTDARDNARRNAIHNLRFMAGLAETLLPQVLMEGFQPDIIVLDPPRKGAEVKVLEAIAQAAPPKVVYVSCHPATQARDVKLLAQTGYRVSACAPVDMFPQTPQVENVMLLIK